MSSARACLLALLLLALGAGDAPGAAPPVRKPTPAQIARWVKELGADDFDVREAASKNLRAAGEAAEEALIAGLRGGDLEAVRRAREILNEFKWGIYPETPRHVLELIRAYRAAAPSEKRAVIKKLVDAGPAGSRVLIKIARAEENVQTRREVFAELARELPRTLADLLQANRFDAIEGLLELGLASESHPGQTNYAAYWLLSGRLDGRIARWEALAKKYPPGKPEAEVLFYLYRAKGDLGAALKAARKAERLDFEEAALYESANWRALSARSELIGTPNAIEKISLQATYARLSGDKKGLATPIARLREIRLGGRFDRPGAPPTVKGLFLNDQIAVALEILDSDGNRPLRFEVLAARGQIGDAFAMVEKARKASSDDLPALELLQARALVQLGEKEKGQAIFKRYADQIKAGTAAPWLTDLIDAENRAGLRDQAFEHAARALASSKDLREPARLFAKFFPDKRDDAELLWAMLSREPKPGPEQRLKLLRGLMEGTASGKEVAGVLAQYTATLIKLAQKKEALSPMQQERLLLALAEAARACKEEKVAVSCLAKVDSALANLRWGDLLAAKKDWARAAQRYARAYELSLKPAKGGLVDFEVSPELPLFLRGWALAQGGKAPEGKKLMERAHLLPLGEARTRYEFARALEKRGLVEAARREWGILRRVGEATLTQTASFYTGEGLLAAGTAAYRAKDYLKAADAYEQAMMRSLRPDVNFASAAAYVGVPAMTHRTRALGLLAAGKVDESLREALLAQAALPGNTEVAVRFVPELERRGRKKEAAALFEQALAVQEKLCRDYPRYASAHNSLAWLSVCCGRNLDKALVHARKAVELSPKSAGYHDTLAEVLFQKGMKKEAIAAQKKAVELAPARAYFRKQLERIEAGDPKAGRPVEE